MGLERAGGHLRRGDYSPGKGDPHQAPEVRRAQGPADKAEATFAEAEEATRATKCELESYKSGDSRDSSNKSLKERLADAKTDLTSRKGEVKASDLQIKHLKKEVAEAKKVAKKKGAENAKLEKDLQKAENALKAAETKLASIDFDEKKTVKLADRLQAEEKEAQH